MLFFCVTLLLIPSQAQEKEQCGGPVIDSYGVITSPNYPQNYNYGDLCVWNIRTSTGNEIIIIIEDLLLEHPCSTDAVNISFTSSQGKILKTFCGDKYDAVILTGSDDVTVTFMSDDSVTRRGFKLRYEAGSKHTPKPTKTRQSSTWDGLNSEVPVQGQDRPFPTKHRDSFCQGAYSKTKEQEEPWWLANYAQLYVFMYVFVEVSPANTVREIEVFLQNRTTNYPSGNVSKCGQHSLSPGQSAFIVACQGTANQIIIQSVRKNSTTAALSLCKVTIYALYCDDGMHGESCTEDCTSLCMTRLCREQTGCTDLCMAGYQGWVLPDCQDGQGTDPSNFTTLIPLTTSEIGAVQESDSIPTVIIGVVVGVVALIVIISVIGFISCRHKIERARNQNLRTEQNTVVQETQAHGTCHSPYVNEALRMDFPFTPAGGSPAYQDLHHNKRSSHEYESIRELDNTRGTNARYTLTEEDKNNGYIAPC